MATDDKTTVKPPFNEGPARVRLGDVCEIIMGQSPSSENYNDRELGLPFFQGNADFGKEHPTAKVWCDSPIKIAYKGDLLLSVRAPIGAINTAVEECCIGRGVAAIRPKSDMIDLDYLKHQLIAARPRLESLGTGSTFKAIGKKLLNDYPIMLDSLENQQNVVHQLAHVNQCMALKEATIDRLDLLVKSRFNEMLLSQAYPSKPLSFFVESHVEAAKRSFAPDDIIQYIDISSIDNCSQQIVRTTPYCFGDAPSRAQQHIQKNDLLISTVRPNLKNVAVNHIDAANLVASSGFCVLRSKGAPIEYLSAIVSSDEFTTAMCKKTTGANYTAIKDSDILSYEVPDAPQKQIGEFADFVSQVDKLRFKVQQQIDKLNQLKKSLMQEYFG